MAQSLTLWAAVALLAWLDQALPHVTGALRADFGISAGIAIISIVSGLFGIFKGKADKGVADALNSLRSALASVVQVLADFAGETGSAFGRVFGVLARLWESAILPFLRKADGWAKRVFQWLRDTFGPLIDALLWLRQKVWDVYDKWLRPIFDTIEIFRRVLSIFSLMGLDLARKIDQQLAELEDRLRRPIDAVLGKINEAIGIVNRVITLDGLLQKYALLKSIERDVRELSAAFRNWRSKPLTDDERERVRRRAGERTLDQVQRDTSEVLTTGGGPYAPFVSEMVAQWEIDLRRVRSA